MQLLLMVSADRAIPNADIFQGLEATQLNAIIAVNNRKTVTFGINPTRHNTLHRQFKLSKLTCDEAIDLVRLVTLRGTTNAHTRLASGNNLRYAYMLSEPGPEPRQMTPWMRLPLKFLRPK